MKWMQFRTDEPEWLDGDSVPMSERIEALGQLPLVNRFLGGSRAVLRELARLLADSPRGLRTSASALRVFDVGCGAADIPEAIARWAHESGRTVSVFALDRDPAAIDLASRRAAVRDLRIGLIRGSALELPVADRAFDVVTASMFCHHFFGDELVGLLRELTRVARTAVIVNDLHRHRAAYWGFRLASRVFLRGQVVRHDGEVSVRRGFVPQELWDLAAKFPEFLWTVRRRFAFRLCLVGRREKP